MCLKYQQSESISERLEQTKKVYKLNWKEAWAVALTMTV
jgi:hypothetical protein